MDYSFYSNTFPSTRKKKNVANENLKSKKPIYLLTCVYKDIVRRLRVRLRFQSASVNTLQEKNGLHVKIQKSKNVMIPYGERKKRHLAYIYTYLEEYRIID